MKKNIGILTFWTSNINYGQILQSYALQEFLKENGHNAYVIRFDSLISKINNIIRLIISGHFLKHYKQRKLRKFQKFKDDNISYSKKKYISYKSLCKDNIKPDIYIVGSDQVWTYMRNKERRYTYLLKFVDGAEKISYAASFGRDNLKEEEKEDFKKALSEFSFIGVREESGVKICNTLDLNSFWVTDPVTLLSLEKWKQFITEKESNRNDKPSVFIYTLSNQNIVDFDNILSDKFELLFCNSSETYNEGKQLYLSIENWLSNIYNSDIIITDSFHCTIFAILFNKKFITIKRENGLAMSNRLTSMLGRLELSERYVGLDAESITKLIIKEINWESINNKLGAWINQSKKLLLENIR